MDILWAHAERGLDQHLHVRDTEERKRQLNRRLQMLYDGNRINFESGEVRLQFLGIRVAEPPNPYDVVKDAQPFERRMVSVAVQKRELRMNNSTQSIN